MLKIILVLERYAFNNNNHDLETANITNYNLDNSKKNNVSIFIPTRLKNKFYVVKYNLVP